MDTAEPSDLFWVLINDLATSDEDFLVHCVNLTASHLEALVMHRPNLIIELCRLGSKTLAIHFAYRDYQNCELPVYERLKNERLAKRLQIPFPSQPVLG